MALAATFSCSANPCYGTEDVDEITGRKTAVDVIYALGGADQVDGKSNNDRIYGGEGDELRLNGEEGDDRVYGGVGAEVFIFGRGGRDLLSSGPGSDNIFADEFPDTDPVVDTVKGGRGNDGIDAVDGFKDIIDCGKGPDDFVVFDRNRYEVAANCERRPQARRSHRNHCINTAAPYGRYVPGGRRGFTPGRTDPNICPGKSGVYGAGATAAR